MKTSNSNLTEICINSETMASGSMLTVKRDQVLLSNGNLSHREYVLHPGAVVIVPIKANGNVILERQFRYPLHKEFIELPAGKIDEYENTLETGKRELLEETGYCASEWIKLGLQYPCIGYSNEVIHMYLARQLTASDPQRDQDECLELFEESFDTCLTMIEKGVITDGKTIVALFFAEKYIQSHY